MGDRHSLHDVPLRSVQKITNTAATRGRRQMWMTAINNDRRDYSDDVLGLLQRQLLLAATATRQLSNNTRLR